MPAKPSSVWGRSLEGKVKDDYTGVGQKTIPAPLATQRAYADWISENVMGLESAPPFANSHGNFQKSAFAPLLLTSPGTPPSAAAQYGAAWFAWYMASTWNPIAPLPPFSVITFVGPSPLGAAASQAALVSGLTAVFSINPTPATAIARYHQIAALFYTATTSAGIQIVGIGLPPVLSPLIIPLAKVF